MKFVTLFLLLLCCFSLASPVHARQAEQAQDASDALAALQRITLPSSKGDSVNIAETIRENRFTLIVMYRGVW